MHGFVTAIVIIGIIAAFIGVFFRLPIFGGRRLVALGVLLLLMTGGVALSESLRSPEQVKADEELDATVDRVLAEQEATNYDDVHANPEKYVSVEPDFVNDYGSVRVSGTLSNSSKYAISNVKLVCDQVGETGKRLDRTSLTITKRVPAEGSVPFGPLSLTFADQQAVSVFCRPVDGDASEYAG